MYNFSMNPYPEFRFSKCPDCNNKTGQRTLLLIIHIDPKNHGWRILRHFTFNLRYPVEGSIQQPNFEKSLKNDGGYNESRHCY